MKRTNIQGYDFDRYSVPPEYADLSLWPRVDYSLLEEPRQSTYLIRAKAVSLYFENLSLSVRDISMQTQVDRKTISRLAADCLMKHEDGRIYGFRALVPYMRLSDYERRSSTAPCSTNSAGDSGEFERLLRTYPELEAYLIKESANRTKPIKRSSKTSAVRQVNAKPDSIHAGFLALCRTLGIAETEYPFNRDYQGARTLYEFVKLHSARKSKVTSVKEEEPEDDQAALANKVAATKMLDRIQIDGHKIDLRVTVSIMDSFGMERLIEIERIWILVILDVVTRAVLGYSLVVSKEYSASDVVEAICSSLRPKPLRKLIIPELKYPEKGGFPSQLFPELCFATWKLLMLDNAKAHLAKSTVDVLVKTVGCWAAFGPKGEPIIRGIIERFFSLLTIHFAHRLPGTTGSSPSDVARLLGDPGKNLKVLIRLEELEDLVDVILAEYNVTAADGIGGRTPLEAVNYLLKVKRQRLIHIPPSKRNDLDLLPEGKVVTIRSDSPRGGRAFVNFHDVRYYCPTLDHKPQLTGTKIYVRYREKDIRRLRGFFLDGSEIGIFVAASPWSTVPHSLAMRKEIKRLVRLGKLKMRPGEEPIRCYLAYKQQQIGQSKRSATKYASAVREQKKAEVEVNTNTLPPATEPDKSVEDFENSSLVDSNAESSPRTSGVKPKIKPLSIKKTIFFR